MKMHIFFLRLLLLETVEIFFFVTCCARLDMIHANEHLNEEKGEIMVVHEYEVLMHEMVKSMRERSTCCFVQRVAYHCKVQSNPDCRLLRQMEIFFGSRECSQLPVPYMEFIKR